MTLPTGAIAFSQINTELGRASNATLSLNDGAVRQLAGISSGAIDMGSLRGKSNVSFSPAPGTYTETDEGGLNFNIVCSVPAVWTYSRSYTGPGTSTAPGSGGTATSLSMSINASSSQTRRCTWSINAVAAGIGVNFSVTLEATPIL